MAAEELGADGAYFRVHHFANQLGSPFPLLAAVGARTSKIEIGTAVIDMRYENPLYMVEDAGAADLIAGGRLQLGISRGVAGAGDRGMALLRLRTRRGRDPRRHGPPPRRGLPRGARGERLRETQPAADVSQSARTPARRAATRQGCATGFWWGSSSNATSKWAAKLGMHLQSSTLKDDEKRRAAARAAAQADSGCTPEAWKEAGHTREPRVWRAAASSRWWTTATGPTLDETAATRTRLATSTSTPAPSSAAGTPPSPEKLVKQLAADEAIAAADTLLPDRPEPAGRRLQRPRHQQHPQVRRSRARLALAGFSWAGFGRPCTSGT